METAIVALSKNKTDSNFISANFVHLYSTAKRCLSLTSLGGKKEERSMYVQVKVITDLEEEEL